jgi:protein-S-isoprenylcysteine O-methyltransferase Ste14
MGNRQAAMLRSLAYTSPYCWIFWAVFLLAYIPEYALVSRSRPARNEPTDRGSMKLIMAAGSIGSLAAFVIAAFPALQMVQDRKIWFSVGLALLLTGSGLRRHCWRMLGKHFTGDVKASAEQPVIDGGAYRWIRHPSYTGGILMYLGTGLAMTSWLSAAVITFAGAAGYVYRVHVEEQALRTNLRGRYQDYMRRTKRFIPYVF